MEKSNLLVLIAGGSGSGKTLFAKNIIQHFSKDGDDIPTYDGTKSVQLISMDNYYKNQDHMTYEERLDVNYDHPNEYDWDILFRDIHILVEENKPITVRKYDFKSKTHFKDKTITVSPSDIIIVEGIFGLYDKRLRDMASLMIYVDTDADIRLLRRLQRDIEKSGLSDGIDRFINQWQRDVKPMHEEFIEPSKRHAHIVVPNTPDRFNNVAFAMLVNMIDSYLVGDVVVGKKKSIKAN